MASNNRSSVAKVFQLSQIVMAATVGFASLGCAGGSTGVIAPPAVAATAPTIRCVVPTFEPTPQTVVTQEHDGISISVVPAEYSIDRDVLVSEQQVGSGVTRTYGTGGTLDTPTREVARTTTPFLAVVPNRAAFLVTVENRQPNDFRMAGAPVQFLIDGRLQAVEQSGFGELRQLIVPKGNHQQVTIYGQSLKNLPSQGDMAIIFREVPTLVAPDGRIITARQFEWHFKIGQRVVEQAGESRTENNLQATGASTPVTVPPPKHHKRQ